jgi:hypothetical protein
MYMGLRGSFRLSSQVETIRPRSGFDIRLGSWGDTHLFNASCNVLSFDEDDQRVQTGRVESKAIRNPALGAAPGPSESAATYVKFARPFKNPPKVTTFISSLDSNKGAYIRISVYATAIDRNGFWLSINGWGSE